MSREAGCCAITGAMDMSAVDKLLEGDPNMDEELVGDTTYCDAAHILPHGNNQAEANGSLVSGANLHPTLHINTYSSSPSRRNISGRCSACLHRNSDLWFWV